MSNSKRRGSDRKVVSPAGARRLSILDQSPEPIERADAARNRASILDAARRLLQERPIDQICMDELAEAAGVGKGTLYRRFEDRASLCRALLHDNALALQAEVLRGFELDARSSWLERLTRLLDALFDFVADNAQLLSEAIAFERSSRRRFEHPAYVWQHDTVALYLSKACLSGEIAHVRADTAADLILAALDPDLLRWHLARGHSVGDLREDFRRFWQLGVLGDRLARPPRGPTS